jgi:hypothetical protein
MSDEIAMAAPIRSMLTPSLTTLIRFFNNNKFRMYKLTRSNAMMSNMIWKTVMYELAYLLPMTLHTYSIATNMIANEYARQKDQLPKDKW